VSMWGVEFDSLESGQRMPSEVVFISIPFGRALGRKLVSTPVSVATGFSLAILPSVEIASWEWTEFPTSTENLGCGNITVDASQQKLTRLI